MVKAGPNAAKPKSTHGASPNRARRRSSATEARERNQVLEFPICALELSLVAITKATEPERA